MDITAWHVHFRELDHMQRMNLTYIFIYDYLSKYIQKPIFKVSRNRQNFDFEQK